MTEKTPGEILEGLRAIFAQDLFLTAPRQGNPIADPALWRAIESEHKHEGLPAEALQAAAIFDWPAESPLHE